MFCSQCGASLAPNARFCSNCAAPLPSGQQRQDSASQPFPQMIYPSPRATASQSSSLPILLEVLVPSLGFFRLGQTSKGVRVLIASVLLYTVCLFFFVTQVRDLMLGSAFSDLPGGGDFLGCSIIVPLIWMTVRLVDVSKIIQQRP
jgi:hypothetical protein